MNKYTATRILTLAGCLLQLAIFHFVIPASLLACPTCKDGLHQDGTAAAYAFSIIFMMGMPFVILSFWITTIIRLRARVNQVPVTYLDC